MRKGIDDWIEQTIEGSTAKKVNQAGFVGNDLVYIEFKAKSKVNLMDSYDQKNFFKLKWDAFIEEEKAIAPPGMKSIFENEGNTWGPKATEKAFSSSAIQGIIIALSFAFGMLLITSKNIWQSLLSIICVAIIITSILALMVLLDWELGMSESVCLILSVGLSVDFVIHLGSSY